MIETKRASEADAQTLCDLARNTFVETFAKYNTQQDMDLYVAETYSLSQQLKEIRDPKRWIEMAWSGEQAVGFVHLLRDERHSSVTGPRPIEILRLYVDSAWHGKGIGATLTDRAIQIVQKEGYQTLWLGVWEKNYRAQAFYKKYGFTQVGSQIFRLGTDDQIDFIWVRDLSVG